MVARHAGRPPISTFSLPGPGARGAPWVVGWVIRGRPGPAGLCLTVQFPTFTSVVGRIGIFRVCRRVRLVGRLGGGARATARSAPTVDEHHGSLNGNTCGANIHKPSGAFQ